MLRVLQVTPAYPPALGGVERYVAGLCRLLAAEGHDVQVLTAAAAGQPHRQRTAGVDVRRLRTLTVPGFRGYAVQPQLPGQVVRAHADIVHAHALHFFPADATAVLRKLTRQPYVFNPYFAPARTPKWRFYQRTLARITARADVTVVISRFEERQLRAADLLGRRVELVPPALRVADYRAERDPQFLARYGIQDGHHRTILSVGRVSRAKGLDLLVEAVARLTPSRPDVRLLVVGPDWGERGALERQVGDLGLQGRVIFTGGLADDSLRTAYSSADVFAFPSRYEAFGLVLIEAMAAGLPIVAVANAAVTEVVDEGVTGLLTPPDDPAALAEALRLLLDDAALSGQLARQAAAHAVSTYDEIVQVRRLTELYASVA